MSNRADRRRAARRPAATGDPTVVATAPTSEPEALVVTHYFDAADIPDSRELVTIRLSGRRVGARGAQDRHDTFTQEERVDGLLAGPASVTSWVYGLKPGEWEVSAEVVEAARADHRGRSAPIRPARWSWRRWAIAGDAPHPVKTRWALLAPLARIPGVIPGIWPALGAMAVVIALLVERFMLPHERVALDVPLAVSVVALVAGLAGAKIWYAVLHPGPWRQALLGGWAVDGFLVVAPIVAVAMLVVLDLPVSAFLDAVTPGLFLAVAIGRIGCFFAGCCAGRVTSSRFGIWSSDRKIGARRIPAQILESAVGLAISVVSMAAILTHVPRVDGALFVGALAVYFVARQSLLRVRAERREFLWRRTAASASGGS
jgi:phosphatidylglycerol:prolipoprotein diacylglycerol transferase